MDNDDTTPKRGLAAALAPAAVLLASFVLADWLVRRNAGSPDAAPGYWAIVVFCAGVAVFVVSMVRRAGPVNRAMGVAGVVLVLVGAIHLGSVATQAKRDLRPHDIGSGVQAADAVVTCVRQNFERSNDPGHMTRSLGWIVFYTYGADGRLYRQHDYLAQQDFTVGQHVKVLYRLGRPQVARLVQPSESLPAVPSDGSAAAPAVALPVPDPSSIAC
ncbi:MAG TPA: hypothetical protein VFK21_12035 [Gammaproteobacteria bacterium]|nr:hypothetical protein [Gammaproteobacteria bacterium]